MRHTRLEQKKERERGVGAQERPLEREKRPSCMANNTRKRDRCLQETERGRGKGAKVRERGVGFRV
jgi:hypothetical protein